MDHYLLLLNLTALLVIGTFPFATALLSEHLTHDGERASVIVYAGCNFAACMLFYAIWSYVRHAGLIDPDTDHVAVERITSRYRLGPPAFGFAFIVAFVAPIASLVILAGLSLFYYLPESVQFRVTRPRASGHRTLRKT